MQIDANDPRLTAYALGELDAEDRREVTMLLETSPEAQAAVEEIRQAADLLTRELIDEPPLQLTNEQRQSVEQAMMTRDRRRWIPLAVAASLLLVAGSLSIYLPSLSPSREFAERAEGLANREGQVRLFADASAQRSQEKTESAKGPQLQQSPNRDIDSITYPKNWPAITARRLGGLADGAPAESRDGLLIEPRSSDFKKYNIEDLDEQRNHDERQIVEKHREITEREAERKNLVEATKQNRIERLMGSAAELRKEGRLDEAIQVLDQVIAIDANHETARIIHETLEDVLSNTMARGHGKERDKQGQHLLVETDEAGIPWHDNIRYPKNWPEITARRLGGVEEAGESQENRQVRKQLRKVVPEIKFDAVPFEEVINQLRTMTGVNIVMNWSALGAAGIEKDSEVSLRLNNVNVGKVLDLILHEGGGGDVEELDYRFTGGIVEISTKRDLDHRRRIDYLDRQRHNTEAYARILDNPFLPALKNPLSTFSIDVDTAAYANVRRFLNNGQFPPTDAVRIEEMINYFAYDYPQPEGPDPFSVSVEVAECPWASSHRLVRIGLKGQSLNETGRPPCNLVFLIDVSGSMSPQNKLPLLKKALGMLMSKLSADDRVAIVTYAGSSRLALPSTTCNNQTTIRHALASLGAGGSTNGGAGIQLAYNVATEHFIEGGANRVILATDGDFNVGITDRGELTRLIREKAQSGVALSVLGFGMGNLKDATLEKLADTGDGNYAYIDTLREAHKVLVEQIGGTLVTIARDVKIQIEFNPQQAQAYRLIGYENRLLAARDFNDDHKDAGEIGAGHTVTALYEVVPVGVNMTGVDPLKYQPKAEPAAVTPPKDIGNGELLTVKLRYKQPQAVKSRLIERVVTDAGRTINEASADFRFAASVASFGMLLRSSPHRGNASFDTVTQLATQSLGPDTSGHRREFVGLVKMAGAMRPR